MLSPLRRLYENTHGRFVFQPTLLSLSNALQELNAPQPMLSTLKSKSVFTMPWPDFNLSRVCFGTDVIKRAQNKHELVPDRTSLYIHIYNIHIYTYTYIHAYIHVCYRQLFSRAQLINAPQELSVL